MTSTLLQTRIIILNYNGEQLLPQCLPSVMEAAGKHDFVKLTILDNQSTDQSLEYLRKNFQDIDVEIAPFNKILCSYNDYLRKIKEPVVILLNNDIKVAPDFIPPLIQKFTEDPLTFLVAPRVMSFNGQSIEAGASRGCLRYGIFWCSSKYPNYEKSALVASSTFSSGFGAFSREKFLELGGYDERYLPGIMEDVDLCFRANQNSYHLYYEPQSVVYHMGQASFKKAFGVYQISKLAHRNNFLFMWKNFKTLGFWAVHLFFLPLRLIYALLKGNLAFIHGFFEALKIRLLKKR